MSARVICISRTVAAGGETIGRLVAERLGFACIDEEIVALASKKAGVDPELVAQSEHRGSILDRLLAAVAAWPAEMPAAAGAFYAPSAELAAQPVADELRALIREAIVEIASRGSAVIVAHAASYALTGQSDVLRVLVTAARETRIERLRQAQSSSPSDAAAAVRNSDKERAFYLRSFYDVGEEEPTHYDLVVNTDLLTVEQAVAAILAAAA